MQLAKCHSEWHNHVGYRVIAFNHCMFFCKGLPIFWRLRWGMDVDTQNGYSNISGCQFINCPCNDQTWTFRFWTLSLYLCSNRALSIPLNYSKIINMDIKLFRMPCVIHLYCMCYAVILREFWKSIAGGNDGFLTTSCAHFSTRRHENQEH